ncbi:MAG: hypothetical protein QOG53_3623 [Frankiales bacterium]|jgi:hypothetical protein|nr:hypothetical protein [Frankiales bacterium]
MNVGLWVFALRADHWRLIYALAVLDSTVAFIAAYAWLGQPVNMATREGFEAVLRSPEVEEAEQEARRIERDSR